MPSDEPRASAACRIGRAGGGYRCGTMHASPPAEDMMLLGAGVLCAATAPPLIAATAAPALAIAFWRTGVAATLLFPVALARGELRGTGAPWLALLGGAALACHFGTFIPSLSYTTVASAAALVCTQAVWAGLLG